MSSNSMSLSALARRPLIVIEAHLSAHSALAIARTEHVHHLPVMRDGALVGLACTCNLQAASPSARVDALMSQPAVTLDHCATLSDAVSAMNTHDIGSVVLLEGGEPCGIVTRGDLLLMHPDVALELNKSRCVCCGLTRHLRTGDDGFTFCIYCFEPGGAERLSQTL